MRCAGDWWVWLDATMPHDLLLSVKWRKKRDLCVSVSVRWRGEERVAYS